jgi:hypothetical protein
MKKTIGLILILVLIGLACFGCAASESGESLPEPSISEGEDVVPDGRVYEENEDQDGAGDSLNPDAPVQSSDDPGNGQSSSSGQSSGAGGGVTGSVGNSGGAQSSTGSQGSVGGKLACTFSINCSTVFDNLDKIDSAIVEQLPQDGWIYPAQEVEFAEGESVFDILQRITRQKKIHMEFNSNPALKSKYVEGIHNLYEFDAGELSGWTYKINGKGMGYGSSSHYPKDGDVIEWLYTCDQGRDVGVQP